MVNEVGEMDSVSPDDHNNSGISVFEIDSPDYKLNFLSWILDITQEEADKGFEFLKRNNKSIEVLWDLLENLKVLQLLLKTIMLIASIEIVTIFIILENILVIQDSVNG